MDNLNARVAKAALGQCGVNCGLVSDQVKSGNSLISLKRAFGTFDYNAAAVVATHDIHCDSHTRDRMRKRPLFPRPRTGQAPAVTVMTWRPL